MDHELVDRAVCRARVFQNGDGARTHSPGDNFDSSKTVNIGKHSRVGSVNSNITINSQGGEIIIEKLYLVLDMDDYWGMKDKEN